ncbi:unnamed protein product [Rotaria sp. Silwood2]|nr:unnamed protein product [Rotaria sp. Silwood2]
MNDTGFTDETFVANILDIFKNHKSITYVSLNIEDIQPSSKKETCLVDSLENSNFISRLQITASVVSQALVNAVICASTRNNTLTRLKFYHSEVTPDDTKQLQSLYDNGNLVQLVFSNSPKKVISDIPLNAKWAQNGVTVAGGHGKGNDTNQLYYPEGIFVDDDQTIVIADCWNHRIVQWRTDNTNGEVVAGGHGQGNRLDQLNCPTNVLIDEKTDTLIISDRGNRRVVRWSRRSGTRQGEILIENIECWGLAMDNQRNLYVSDVEKHEIKKYGIGNKNAILVAGYGLGSLANQFRFPSCIFLDQQHDLYVADTQNNRVMKWNKGSQEGTFVAKYSILFNLLTYPMSPVGLFVDGQGTLYVAESGNNRVTRWPQGSNQSTIIAGGNGYGEAANQFQNIRGLSFDRHGNLFVVDGGSGFWGGNHRVQRFSIE